MFEKFNKEMKLNLPPTQFTGYEKLVDQGEILALFNQEAEPVETLKGKGYLILNQTPIFAVGGGQNSDQGNLYLGDEKIDLLDITKDVLEDYFLHAVDTHQSTLKIGDQIKVEVNQEVRSLHSIHHSALHLTWQELLNFVGHHIPEQGSKITDQKFNMEFENEEKMTPELVDKVVQYVNQKLFSQNIESKIFWVSQEEAKEKNWLFFFTKLKKDEKVRIVEFENHVLEPCSGTHVKNTKEIPQEYFLDFDKNAKRILITATCNQEFAKKWFAEKNETKYQEITNTINKLKNMNFTKDLSQYEKESKELVDNWSYIATKKLNNLLLEINKIANQFFAEKSQEVQDEYWNLNPQSTLINNFLIYETKNENYTNKVMLKKASYLANQNVEQIIVLLNSSSANINAVIIHNKKINFNLRIWLNEWMKETSFKGGGNDSMFQITSSQVTDCQNLINYIKETK